LGQAGDGWARELPEQPQEVLEPTIQHQTAPEDPKQPQLAAEKQEQPQPAVELQVPKTAEVGGSAKPGEEAEPSAPAIEEILGHYEEESIFCGTRSYTMEIPVGDKVRAVEAVGKIFLEEVKVSLT
jgi:hypothetical protein